MKKHRAQHTRFSTITVYQWPDYCTVQCPRCKRFMRDVPKDLKRLQDAFCYGCEERPFLTYQHVRVLVGEAVQLRKEQQLQKSRNAGGWNRSESSPIGVTGQMAQHQIGDVIKCPTCHRLTMKLLTTKAWLCSSEPCQRLRDDLETENQTGEVRVSRMNQGN